MGLVVRWEAAASRAFKKLTKRIAQRISQAIASLANDPYQNGVKGVTLRQGSRSKRVGGYRIIFRVDAQGGAIIVEDLAKRDCVYRQLLR